MKFQNNLPSLRRYIHINITLLPNPNLIPQGTHNPASFQRIQRQYIVPAIRQTVPVVPARTIVRDQFIAEEILEEFVGAAVSQVGEGGD